MPSGTIKRRTSQLPRPTHRQCSASAKQVPWPVALWPRSCVCAPGWRPHARPLLAQVICLNATAMRNGKGPVGRQRAPSGSSTNPGQSALVAHAAPPPDGRPTRPPGAIMQGWLRAAG